MMSWARKKVGIVPTVLVLLVAGWVLMSPPVAMSFYNGFLFQTFRYPIGFYDLDAIANVERHDVYFPSANGSKLHGWWFPNQNFKPVILISHGSGGNLTFRGWLINSLLLSGASVFIYDYQGYGRSEGDTTIEGTCDDARAAYDYLTRDLSISPKRIFLYGESYGTGVTCKLASEVPCKGVILQSGYASLRESGRQILAILNLYPQWLFPQPELDNRAYVSKRHPPLLLLHGLRDTLLPCTLSTTLFHGASEPKSLLLMPGADHFVVPLQPEFIPTVYQFVNSVEVAEQPLPAS
jgi:uncharacterized protein